MAKKKEPNEDPKLSVRKNVIDDWIKRMKTSVEQADTQILQATKRLETVKMNHSRFQGALELAEELQKACEVPTDK